MQTGSPTQPGSTPQGGFARDRFTPNELRAILARYDLGQVTAARELHAGTSSAPKAVIESESGRYVLKRRESTRSDPYRVAQTHDLQLRLADAGVPVPFLVGTHDENNSMAQVGRHIYEVTMLVEGRPYSGDPREARALGGAIAFLHEQLLNAPPKFTEPPRLEHPGRAIRAALAAAATERRELLEPANDLAQSVARLVHTAPPAGDERAIWLHGDWHPGNVLFHESRVVAIFDFDGVHLGPRRLDVGQAIAHFTSDRRSGPPETWPDALDINLAGELWAGYAARGPVALGPESLPAAVGEALALEVAMAAHGTGPTGRATPAALIRAVTRRIDWLERNARVMIETCRAAAGGGA